MTGKAWATSKRTVPSDWKQRKARVLRHHGGICHICHQPGAVEVDHIVPVAEGGSHEYHNLAPIHPSPCHEDKTRAEKLRGIARKPTQRRPPEQHPGLLP